MRISDWSSDVCSSDLHRGVVGRLGGERQDGIFDGNAVAHVEAELGRCHAGRPLGHRQRLVERDGALLQRLEDQIEGHHLGQRGRVVAGIRIYRMERSEEHTSELQSLMRNSYAVFCLKKQNYTLKKI